jgi:GNAT superfamily N-acetyltransferase
MVPLVKPRQMSQSVTVRPVRSKEDLKAFLDVPFALYAGDPNWVAPLYLERFEHLDPKKNPYYQHAEVELFLALRGGRPVGRISAQLCRLRSERYKDGVGQFGFLEAEDDPATFSALLEAAAAWLKQRGATAIQGPFSFSINDETGLLIEGFDTPPSMMMGHALAHYGPRLEEAGFGKVKDVIAYDFIAQGGMPRALKSAHDKAVADPDVVLRPLDKKQLMKELQIVVSIANDAWSDNWGFVPWTQEEMTALANNLKMLVTGDYIAIAEYKGEPAAMAITLPNINEWIAGLDGRLLPFGWAKLAWSLFARPPKSVRMPLMGLRRAYHGTPVGAVLGMAVIARVYAYHVGRGTTRGEASWILEDNMPMRRMIESFGGRPYKTYRIYEKLIG